jgi:hypothetical protein
MSFLDSGICCVATRTWPKVSSGSWLCEKADVLRRRRIAFSSVTSPRLLARGSPLDAHRCRGAETSKTPSFLRFWCAGYVLPFMLPCVEQRVIWRACRNKILTIFAPCTFSHTQGQIRPPRPDPEDVAPRRVTLRFLTQPPRRAEGLPSRCAGSFRVDQHAGNRPRPAVAGCAACLPHKRPYNGFAAEN